MTVTVNVADGVAHVLIDNPPVNALSRAVREGLLRAVAQTDADPDVRAVVLRCAGRTFVAGADVREFDAPPVAPHLPDVIAVVEDADKPWLALIHGNALGGGMELALGCRWRLAVAGSKLGFPEVNLGLIPGAGGTVRTPRLTGIEAAVDLATSGKPVSASKAAELGLIDAVIDDEDAIAAAMRWLDQALDAPLPLPTSQRPVIPIEEAALDAAEARLRKSARGAAAPGMALSSLRNATTATLGAAMAFEREIFLERRASAEAAALRAVFMAERAASKPADLKGVSPRPFARVGIIGGGTMGAGIAVAMLNAGLSVQMVERDAALAERGRSNVEGLYTATVARGRMNDAQMQAHLARFSVGDSYDALAGGDLVIEGVFEDLKVKREVFARLVEVCPPETILATNTSYLDPEAIFEGLAGPDRFLGLHFFSPAHVMKLLEIVPTAATAPEVLATAFALAKQAGKMPVRTGICDGFIGNRILKGMRLQAERLILAGCAPAEVDGALRGFGLAMGPFEVQDLAGLDIAAYQRQAARERGQEAFAPIADLLVAAGRLGRKTGAGWYDYVNGSPQPGLPEAVNGAILAARDSSQASCRSWTPEEIVEAVLFPMVNEAARIVSEGIANSPVDIDLVEIHGYGFPRHRGGPVCYARQLGLKTVIARLEALHDAGLSDAPCDELRSWASASATPSPKNNNEN
ncbi:3-hydroxyacyl-CoA dehydrogenase NAD-binding domain-containing protein [Sulfitobacter sp. W074]|uniref:3-hydroxyacyl-CoA dehydrogenase NAD-binding domain-containing protein n=1 Tax=Sulfitobacter sp. W074 TaxID=2867026 RepID=UPI0021A4E09D|nr:3-hydroxyacyl-CoA dehydrogenase NAD-binding domain-containing protein [Sulfitobacter sp. W074]UWR39498.1 enoyl-CoA hydratase/isomerase family protein [Sulfitobacter sp. W074]